MMFKNALKTAFALSAMFGLAHAHVDCTGAVPKDCDKKECLKVKSFEFIKASRGYVMVSVPPSDSVPIPDGSASQAVFSRRKNKFNIRVQPEYPGCVGGMVIGPDETNPSRVLDECEKYTPYTVYGDNSVQDLDDYAAEYKAWSVSSRTYTEGKAGVCLVSINSESDDCSGKRGPWQYAAYKTTA